jgi:LPXTG-site transpeptidase (sortase) family protein
LPTWEVPTPKPTPQPSGSAIAQLSIPSIRVGAPISVKGVDAHGVMQDPNSWNDVAYYNFTGRPGFGDGNNAVFAGHVDYIRHGPAVFWDLNKLKKGDEVHIKLQDGTDYTYYVTQMAVYPADDAPVEDIIGGTPHESVTLITCNGVFSAGEYNNRLVVRAERLVLQTLPLDQINPGD